MKTNLYFIGNKEQGFMKIGTSKNPKNRLSELQVGNPIELKTYKIIEDVDQEYETYIHSLFKEDRVRGEWFKITKKLTDFMDIVMSEEDIDQYESISKTLSHKLRVIKTSKEKVKLLKKCRKEGIPFIAIIKIGKKYWVEYNFFSTPYYMLNNCSHKVIGLIYEQICKYYFKRHPKEWITTSHGKRFAALDLKDLDLCKRLMRQIYDIVLDPKNWQIEHELVPSLKRDEFKQLEFEKTDQKCMRCGTFHKGRDIEFVNQNDEIIMLCKKCNRTYD